MNNDKGPRRPHGPAGRSAPGEKPKNLKLTISKLIKYLKHYRILILIAILLASFSSVLSIIGPNKLSKLTDEVSNGLVINKENLNLLIKDIQKDIYTNFELNEEQIASLNEEDKELYLEALNNYNNANNEEKMIIALTLPGPAKIQIFNDTLINGVLISREDKLELIESIYGIDMNNTNELYSSLDNLSVEISSLIKPSININNVKKIGLTLAIIYILSAIFSYVQNYLMIVTTNYFSMELRGKISHKINKLPLKYFDSNTFGDILSRVTNDVETINISLHNSLGTFVSAVSLLIGSIIMMFATNWLMAITGIISSLFGFIFMTFIVKKSQKYFVARQNELGKLEGHIEEIYSSHNVVKAYNGEQEALDKFEVFNNGLYNANRMSQFLSGLMGPMMGFIGNIGYVAVCIVGSMLVVKGQITFGVIVAFIMYVRLFTSPLNQIAQSMTSLQTAASASERVFEFIEENEMSDESNLKVKLDKNNVKGNIEFDHVKFGYDKDKIVIKDFNCKVKPGQKIAIVGPTGAGKTTMVNLLMKFYEINNGDIKIDGVSIKELTRENIHDLFIMVLQDTWLFNGTIKENIKFNKKNVTDEEIWDALETVGIDHFVKSLPKTLNYELGDNDSISIGQKQLLTIARGMIENSPFLILDEATSSVDTRTEELVQKAMDKLTKGRTSFIIAHRLSTIKNADLILVMKDGNIIEQGTHDELLSKKGFYSELYNSQFQN